MGRLLSGLRVSKVFWLGALGLFWQAVSMGFGWYGEGGNARSVVRAGGGDGGFRQVHVNFDGVFRVAWVYKGFSMGSCLGHMRGTARRG